MCEPCLEGLTRRRFLGLSGLAVSGGLLSASVFSSRAGAQGDGMPIGGGHVIQPRSVWGAGLPPTGPIRLEAPGDVRFLLVHHSASPNGYSAGQSIGFLRSFYRYHTSAAKGWPDIAYNFLVDSYGQIFEGRQGSLLSPVRGDATGGSQGYALLCCFIGDHRDVAPTGAAQSAMVVLLAWMAGTYGIDPSPGSTTEFVSRGSNLHSEGTVVVTPTITGHRTMSRTSCPGDQAFALVRDSFPQQVSDVLSLTRSTPADATVATVASTSTLPTSIVEPVPSTTPPVTIVEPAGSTATPTTVVEPATSSTAPSTNTEPVAPAGDPPSGTADGATEKTTTTLTVAAGSGPSPSSASTSPRPAESAGGPRSETVGAPDPPDRSGSLLDLWPIASMVAGLSMIMVAARKHLSGRPDPAGLGGHGPDVENEQQPFGSQP